MNNIVIEYIYFFLILLVLNSYVLYFFTSKIIASFCKRKETGKNYYPGVSILISAYNEEKVIQERIQNILQLNYPQEKIEILIGSDGSTDKTNIVLENNSQRIDNLKIFLFSDNRGKAEVLNDLVNKSKNEILVFTDANTVFDKDSLKILVSGFSDENIGGVCGRLILKDNLVASTESVEEKQYWKLETELKKAEGKCGILIGANGGIFAVRKNLFERLPAKPVTDDLYISLSVLTKGKKFIYKENAVATEDVGRDVKTEYKRKVRFAATNFQTLVYFKKLLFNPNLKLTYAFWSHKVIRWFSPFIFILIFFLNIFLLSSGTFYIVMMFLQILFYLPALLGYVFSKLKIKIKIFSLAYFFVVSHLALAEGFVKFIRKKHSAKWISTQR